MNNENGKTKYLFSVPFFLVLAALTVVAWLLPLRPTQSADEKRDLAVFPEFSVEALVGGEWFSDIDTWFSDTFTFREAWLSVSEFVQTLYGHSKVGIYGGLSVSDTVRPTATPTPTEEISPWDKVDTDTWHGNVVGDDDFVQFGTVLQIDDACYEFFYFYRDGADTFAGLVNKAAEIADGRARVYTVLAPTAIGIMFEPEYLEEIGCPSEEESLDYIYGQLKSAKGVDTYEALRYRNGEYIYFRTDHHWTAQAAYYAYRQFCNTAGYTPADLNSFTKKSFDGYKGSLWSYANRSHSLTPDTVYAFVPPGDIDTVITTSEGATYGIDIICDMTNASAGLKYLCFISGDNPFTHITNNSSKTEKNCLVIKDSFGNCFVPYLTQNYKNIYVIDYRSYRDMTLDELIDAYGIDDVIFVNSIAVAQADVTTSNIAKVVGEKNENSADDDN